MTVIICPGCESDLKIKSRLRRGEQFSCRHCRAELEVLSLDPIEIDFAEDIYNRRTERNTAKARRLQRKQQD